MAQLLVRNLEDSLVKQLKLRAAAEGVSVEELHRRILPDSVENGDARAGETPDAPLTFKEHLMNIPKATCEADEKLFERDRTIPDRATPIDWLAEFAEDAEKEGSSESRTGA